MLPRPSAVRHQPAKTSTSLLSIIVLAGAILSAGCATKPAATDFDRKTKTGPEFGQWRGAGSASRAIKGENGTKNENWSLRMEVVSRTPGYGRIEITGAMGVYGGTVVWNEEETKILLPGQKKFVVAPNSSRAFLAILPVEISPSEIEAILFDRDFDLKGLSARQITCKTERGKSRSNAGEYKEICSNESGFSLERTRGSEEIKFEARAGDSAKVSMALREVRSKVQERAELWQLEAPRGFRIVR
ncbi:MAG: hypothetical protein RBT63_03390 [Bdellovibrionales bacterium]|jgi:hypothetical protein|nr:hypothetical protein [Bdellovibrionales bacterium]